MAKDKPEPSAELRATALAIFNHITADSARGFNHREKAHEAFRRAKAFLDLAEEIDAGLESAEAVKPDVPEEVEVPVLEQKSDEKWVQVVDPMTNRPVMQRVPVDHYAYAPNLPDSHPINLRFKPHDGIPASKRSKLAAAHN